MVGIGVLVETVDGKGHEIEINSGSLSLLLTKFPIRLRKLVKKVENEGEKVLSTKVVFKGSWNMLILDRFTKGLDKRGIEWKWEL